LKRAATKLRWAFFSAAMAALCSRQAVITSASSARTTRTCRIARHIHLGKHLPDCSSQRAFSTQ
jgi:hypothetical protein